jgi:MFS family permease
MIAALRRAFTLNPPYPPEHRRNFILLFLDIAFFGVLNGSTVVFLAVYASRVGATPAEVGILTAAPALMNTLLSFPASSFGRGKSNYNITRWAWLFTRIFYALLIPLPLLFHTRGQIWIIIAVVLAMNIPGTVAAVIGTSFFAETVPLRYRGSVVGTRNALLAAASMITAFVVGRVSLAFPFAQQYAIVFAIGFTGSMLSCLMLFLIRPVKEEPEPEQPAGEISRDNRGIRPEIVRGPFGRVVGMVFIFHIGSFWANPIFPLYQTRELHFTDLLISQGTSLFWIIYFLSSTQTGTLARRLGFRRLLGIGGAGSALALLVFTFSYQPWIYLLCQTISGVAWAMIGGGLLNYVLERVPANDRPPHLAWYNMAVNVAVLICGLLVPQTTGFTGLMGGMLLGTALRLVSGIVILVWG